MRRLEGLLIAFAFAASAAAQVTLSTVQNGQPTLTGQAFDFGAVSLGSFAGVQFRLTNIGTTSVYLTSLGVTGSYKTDFPVNCGQSQELCGNSKVQQLPILINPTGTLDFTLQFEPFQLGSPSAQLNITAGNAITLVIFGEAVPD